mmetsp:Transcript_21285/g.34610  ORF Transcript_21285/g.34610 Transcript_21285/m.34610 type:complete len:554 (+) Transcript_21285:732-2393(+)
MAHTVKNCLLLPKKGNMEVVRKLLNPDREVVSSALESYKTTLSLGLAEAASSPSSSGATDVVVLLLTCGAKPFMVVDEKHKWNAVHFASYYGNEKALEKLLSFGSQELATHLEDRTGESRTALHLAAESKHPKCIRLLLRHGADITSVCSGKQTAVDLVIQHGDDSGGESDATAIAEGVHRDPNKQKEALDALNDPSTLFWSHSVRANRLYGAEDYHGARDAYTEAIQLTEKLPDERITSDTNRATLYYNSARACVKIGKQLEAIERCTTALELRNGVYPNALAQRASCYMSLFDYNHAVQDYESLLQQDSDGTIGGDMSPSIATEDWTLFLERAKDLAAKATDHYLVLGIPPDANAAQTKQAFRKQCLKWHPDKHQGNADDTARASIMFKAINEANEVINDEQKRTIYDIERISKRMDEIVRRQNEENQGWKSTNTKKSRRGSTSSSEFVSPEPSGDHSTRARTRGVPAETTEGRGDDDDDSILGSYETSSSDGQLGFDNADLESIDDEEEIFADGDEYNQYRYRRNNSSYKFYGEDDYYFDVHSAERKQRS